MKERRVLLAVLLTVKLLQLLRLRLQGEVSGSGISVWIQTCW